MSFCFCLSHQIHKRSKTEIFSRKTEQWIASFQPAISSSFDGGCKVVYWLASLTFDFKVGDSSPDLHIYDIISSAVLEITVGHRTLSDQFCHMVGHDVRTGKTSFSFFH